MISKIIKTTAFSLSVILSFALISCEKEDNTSNNNSITKCDFPNGSLIDSVEETCATTDYFEELIPSDNYTFLYILYSNYYYYYSLVTETDNSSAISNDWQRYTFNNKHDAIAFAKEKAKEGYETKIGKKSNLWIVCIREP